jgi:hypothetical protein
MADSWFASVWSDVDDDLKQHPEARFEVVAAERQATDRAVVLLNFMEVALRDKRARPAAPAAPAKAKPK